MEFISYYVTVSGTLFPYYLHIFVSEIYDFHIFTSPKFIRYGDSRRVPVARYCSALAVVACCALLNPKMSTSS